MFEFIGEFLNVAAEAKGCAEAVESGDPSSVQGPLSARIFDISEDFNEKVFNVRRGSVVRGGILRVLTVYFFLFS